MIPVVLQLPVLHVEQSTSEMNELLGEEFRHRDNAISDYLVTMQGETSVRGVHISSPQIFTDAFPEVLTQLKPHHVKNA